MRNYLAILFFVTETCLARSIGIPGSPVVGSSSGPSQKVATSSDTRCSDAPIPLGTVFKTSEYKVVVGFPGALPDGVEVIISSRTGYRENAVPIESGGTTFFRGAWNYNSPLILTVKDRVGNEQLKDILDDGAFNQDGVMFYQNGRYYEWDGQNFVVPEQKFRQYCLLAHQQ